jgi:hypothetical protein
MAEEKQTERQKYLKRLHDASPKEYDKYIIGHLHTLQDKVKDELVFLVEKNDTYDFKSEVKSLQKSVKVIGHIIDSLKI